MTFKTRYSALCDMINQELTHALQTQNKKDEFFQDILKYGVLNGGKRIRPILLMESYRLFSNKDRENVLSYAIALELIHNYSLIHDDLPCMDNDDYRRGKLTVHKKYGECLAVLAGDALLNLAYEILLEEVCQHPSKNSLQAAHLIASHAGIQGMIGGQVYDTQGLFKDKDELEELYEKKTGALIEAAILAGTLLAEASDEEFDIMKDYSHHLGLAFQLQDDFLDEGEEDEPNVLLFLSKEECLSEIQFHSEKAVEALRKLDGYHVDFLHNLTERLINRRF